MTDIKFTIKQIVLDIIQKQKKQNSKQKRVLE